MENKQATALKRSKLKVNKMVEKMMQIALLYDFYGELLTDKQKSVMDLHYENDYTLAEISEELCISRQAVHDALKTCEKTLCEYEEKLGLVRKFINTNDTLKESNMILAEAIHEISRYNDCEANIGDIVDKLKKVEENNRKLTDNQ